MAADELTIAKQALLLLGETLLPTSTDGTVANINETDWPQVIAIQALFEQSRLLTLRAFPWPFALKYALLTLNDDGDAEVWEDEWANAYDYPTDCVQALRFITATGPSDRKPPQYRVGYHGTAKVIFTDVQTTDANLLYIRDASTTTEWTPEFDMAFSARLAYDISMPLSADEARRKTALEIFALSVSQAQRVDANEDSPHELAYNDGEFLGARIS